MEGKGPTMKKASLVLIFVAILVAALALTGCGSPKTSAEKLAPEAVSGTISETIVPEEEPNEFGLDDGKFEGEDPGVEWEEFQREYKLALLDAKNGGTVYDRGSWSDYWAIVPFDLEEAEMTDEAAQAAKMSLDILERGGDKPSDFEGGVVSELQLLAGVDPE